MKSLQKKVAVVTGAASGIGKACALEFAAEGMDVVVSDINEEGLNSVVLEIEAKGSKALAKKTDVSEENEVKDLIAFACESFGGIDLIMNNAGTAIGGEIKDLEISDWKYVLGINMWGVIFGVHYALPKLIERGGGQIINTSSLAGLITGPSIGAYAASKFAVVGMSEVLRSEVARYNIGVTCLCPGFINTNLLHTIPDEGMRKEIDEDSMIRIDEIMEEYATSPETVAKSVVKAVKKNRFLQVVAPEAHVLYHFKRLLPTAYYIMGPILGNNMERLLKLKYPHDNG